MKTATVSIPDDLEYLGEKFTPGMAWIDLQILLSDGPKHITIRELSHRWKWEQTRVFRFIKKLVEKTVLQQECNKSATRTQQGLLSLSINCESKCNKNATRTQQERNKNANPPSRVCAQVIDILEQDNNTLQEHNIQVQDTTPISTYPPPAVSKDTAPPSFSPLPHSDEKPPVIPPKKPAKKFVKPTVEDVRAYCEERSNGIEAQAFIDFYEANGWVQGRQGKPIKDWKACVRTWERMPIRSGRKQTTKPTGSTMDQYTEFMKQIDEEYGLTNNLHSEVDEQ